MRNSSQNNLLTVLEPGFDPNQFGCRRHRSTTDALIAILHNWQTVLDKGGAVRALFVDFKKAFDLVNHNLLLEKCISRNVPHCLVKWLYSYLKERCQRVRIGDVCSGWLKLNGAMPQGSWLGPLSFLVLIDDLHTDCLIHKYVDDTTLTELLHSSDDVSHMQYFFEQLISWSVNNDMVVNFDKTKEMVIGPPRITSKFSLLSTTAVSNPQIERVATFKLLGVHLDANFSWSSHVEATLSKATQRLYFLKQLKRAGLPSNQLMHYYLAVIRPVLEYAAPVWDHLITKSQTDQLEAVQKRALRIIFSCTYDMRYSEALFIADIESLSDRRQQLSRNFFDSVTHPTSCLFHLLPASRNSALTSRLRSAPRLPRIQNRTKKYQTFVSFALAHFQSK